MWSWWGTAWGVRSCRTWQSVRPLLVLVALLAAVVLLAELLRGATAWVRTTQAELLKVLNEHPQNAAQVFAVGGDNVAPHFGRAGSDSSGVAKAGRADRRLFGRMHRTQNVVRQLRRDVYWSWRWS